MRSPKEFDGKCQKASELPRGDLLADWAASAISNNLVLIGSKRVSGQVMCIQRLKAMSIDLNSLNIKPRLRSSFLSSILKLNSTSALTFSSSATPAKTTHNTIQPYTNRHHDLLWTQQRRRVRMRKGGYLLLRKAACSSM